MSAPFSVSVTVAISYLHHRGPHHADTPGARADKARVSAEAMSHERTFIVDTKRPSRWTARALVRLMDGIRATMPRDDPEGFGDTLRRFGRDTVAAHDRFRDGRALLRVWFESDGPPDYKRFVVAFSTVAGYRARVELPEPPPAAALVGLVDTADRFFNCRLELNRGAIAGARRRVLGQQERVAAAAHRPVW